MTERQRAKLHYRESRDTTPRSGALRARFPSSRPPDYCTLVRRKQEEARDSVVEFTKYQQTCDLRTTWEKSTDRRILLGTIERQVKDALNQYASSVDERRSRLRAMLEAEEQEFMKEMEINKETVLERHTKMQERVKTLRERRENERQQFVADKLEQLFIQQNEDLRAAETKRRQDEICIERAAQLRTKQEQQRQQQQEERVFSELWDADRQAKEQRECDTLQRIQQNNKEHLGSLKIQMEDAEQRKQQATKLKEEEARLVREQVEMLKFNKQREQLQKLQAQETWRGQLHQSLRLKMRRLAREQQEELALDMSILQQVLREKKDTIQDATQRKNDLRIDQQRYRQYLADELENQKKQEEELEKLIDVDLKETWARREKRSQMEREARNRLMKDVIETRNLQIQQKLDLNAQKQIELAKESDELNRTIREMNVLHEEQRRRQKQGCLEYQADLLAQRMHQEQLCLEKKAQEQREYEQCLVTSEEYIRKTEEILSRPHSNTIVHPFKLKTGDVEV